jgi:hypothetical protein
MARRFWYPYRNIDALVESLSIESPFTPYTRSSFWTPSGLQVRAAVTGQADPVPSMRADRVPPA